MSEVLTAVDGQVMTISLNRPHRLNAVSEELYRGIIEALENAASDDGVRAVVLTGEGRAFCVGADLKAHGEGERTDAQKREYVLLGQAVCRAIQESPIPVVAAVRGYALGAGAEMATSADFLLMADDARMGFPEVSIGTFVGGGVTHRLPRLIGLRRAIDLLVLGERFTGEQAADWGVARVSTHDAVRADATALARTLAAKAPLSFARMKAALHLDPTIDQAFDAEAEDLLDMMKTEDWAEGVAAFAANRSPRFQGR